MDVGLEVKPIGARRATVAVTGRLNAVTAPRLKAKVAELVASGRSELVCDLTGVSFLDSSGLAALVSGLKAAREQGGFLKLVGLSEQVARIFQLTMLDRVFELHPTVADALA